MICFVGHCDGEIAHGCALNVVNRKGNCGCGNGNERTSRRVGNAGRNQSIHSARTRRDSELIAEVVCLYQVGRATRGGDTSCSIVAGFEKGDVNATVLLLKTVVVRSKSERSIGRDVDEAVVVLFL